MEGIKLTGLWKNKAKSGKPYLSGRIGAAKILIFPNEHKQAENHPDYNVFIVPGEKKETKPGTEGDDSNYDPL